MGGLNIRLQVWLSIAIFALGYSLSTIADYAGRLRSEEDLSTVSQTLIPASRNAHSARTAFLRAMQDYENGFLMEDPTELDHAAVEGNRALESLQAVGRSPGVAAARSKDGLQLASDVRLFLHEANAAYYQIPFGSKNIAQTLERKIMLLGMQAEKLEARLASFDGNLAADLDAHMDKLQRQSARMREFALTLFAATMLSALILVHITIHRSILRPLSKAQSDLAHERDLLRILLDHIPDYIYFKDARGKFVRINQALAPVLGVAQPEDAIGRRDADYFDPATTALIEADDARIRASGKPVISKIEQLSRSGKSRWVATTKVPVMAGMPPEQMIVGISRDVTQWRNTVAELERSEKSFRLLFSAIPHAIFACDVETLDIMEVNHAACRTYGYSPEEFRRMRLTDIYPPADHAQLKRTVQELDPAKPWRGFRKHIARDGRVLDVEVADHFLEFHGRRTILVTAQDLSEQKRLEIELQHAQRLEAVGQLAAGIAHEINTPIQYVGDNLRFLCDTFRERQKLLGWYERLVEAAASGAVPGSIAAEIVEGIRAVQRQTDAAYLEREIPRALEQSLDGVDRVAAIVRAMKAFAHPGSQEKKPADLNKALSDALIVARNELKYVADVETHFGALPPVWCHIGDLNQVFLNLLINAAHAIGDAVKTAGGRGKICVRTRQEKDEAVVSISDTGCGIPAEIQDRIFDPFFTTKEVGTGTGQGLAIARNIVVEKHGGRIAFEPNFPQGTTFVVCLPLEEARAASSEAATATEVEIS